MNLRLFAVAGSMLALLAVFAYFVFTRDPGIVVTSATAKLSSESKASASIFFNVENKGEPDLLLSVTSPYASNGIIVRPQQFDKTAIPAASPAVFSADGVFLQLSGLADDLKPGDLVPVTLLFQQAGEVSFKAIISESSDQAMDHSGHSMDHSNHNMDHGSQNENHSNADLPEPKLSLSVARKQDKSGWQIDVSTENFTFFKPEDSAPHAPGQGHAHVYLNGLKLQRLYGSSASFGNLPSGTYTLNVTLNTNMHNVYLVNGKAVSADAMITVD